MPPKKKGNGASDRPRDQPSLFVAFAKQIKLQKCTVCSKDIPAGLFASHRSQCRVREDDDECQITFTQTAQEKWDAGLITLDELEEAENTFKVKKEGETPTTSRGRPNAPPSQRRRATKRKIGEDGESAEDDSDFVPASQESEEDTVRAKDEPVRTRRSARVSLPPAADIEREEPRPTVDDQAEDDGAAAEAGNEDPIIEEMEDETGDDLDATIYDEEEEDEVVPATVSSAASTPTSRRLTRSSAAGSPGNNQILAALDAPPSPFIASQGSSMNVETGFMGDSDVEEEQREQRGKDNKGDEGDGEQSVDLNATLNATLPPPEEQARVTRRQRRGQKVTVAAEDETLCDTIPPPPVMRRVTRRSLQEFSQGLQPSQEPEATASRGRKERDEEKMKQEETKRRNAAEEQLKQSERDKEEKEKEKQEETKRGEEKERRRKEQKEKEKRKKQEEEEKERREKEEQEAKKKGEKSVMGLTKIILRALEDKCVRHEKGLVSSQELVQAAVIELDEDDPEVVPHYVYLVCKIMRRVLSTRTSNGRVHDETFWGEDLKMVSSFLALKDDAKLLFIRLFTRKRGWHLPEKLKEKYVYIAARIDAALAELHRDGFLENGKTFLTSTEETLRMCPMEKLKLIAKDFRVDANRVKPALIAALLAAATSQKQLFVQGTPGSNSRLLAMAKKQLGPVYRTSACANALFRALFSLYSPALTDSHMLTDDRTINILSNMMFRLKNIHYESAPRLAPFPCVEMIGVYERKEELYEFVHAKESEERLMRALDRHDMSAAIEEATRARERLTEITTARIDYLLALPAHHQQYTAEAILTRVMHKGIDCLERKKEYPAACNWMKFIIRNQLLSTLISNSIGALYERLALDLHHHCQESEEAIDQIRHAFDDPLVPAKHRLNLDDRAKRILKDGWENRFTLTPATEVVIQGEILGRDLGDERKNRFVRRNEKGEVEHISVEQVALRYFLTHGMEEGFHSEGEIWHLAFRSLFHDVINSHKVGGVWLCELQTQPADYDYSLYEARKEEFEERFEWLRNSSEADRHEMVERNWPEGARVTVRQMKSFLTACDLPTLIGVMEILVKEPRHRRSGFPDLVTWSVKMKSITVAEVKGPGDTLSSKQKLWLDFFMQQDPERVEAYVAKVSASGRRRLM